MKFTQTTLTVLLGVASATPLLEVRTPEPQMTANDIKSGTCKKITLVFARASTEPGNMGMSMGPTVCSGLKSKFSGDVACQGVGGAYSAGLPENALPAGTTEGAIKEAVKMFTETSTKCPNTIIVAGGYSQGTAVMMNAVKGLPEDIKNKVAGVVLFGYTKNAQTKSSIPNYPKEKVKVFCSSGDGVCGGTLLVTIGHFSYMADGSGPKSIAFLVEQINSAGSGSGSADAGSDAEAGADASAEAEAPAKGKLGKLGKLGKGKGKGGLLL